MASVPRLRAATLVSMLLVVTAPVPAEEAINQSVLDRLDAEFANGQHGYIDSLLVLHRGKTVIERRYTQDYLGPFESIDSDAEAASFWGQGEGEYYYVDPAWHPWLNGGDLHTLQSVTKSFTSALIGIAIQRGEIESVDIPIAPLLDSNQPFRGDPRAEQLTLRHLLTMTTGIDWNETDYLDEDNDGILMENESNWQQYVLDQPFSDNPGDVFNYNSGNSLLLDVILFKKTGMHAEDYARDHLFKPLGIKSYHWKTSPDV